MINDQDKISLLVASAQNGDIDAFSQIYDFFLEPVYRFMFFRVSLEQEAEDLTSEVFLKTWKSLKKYQKKEGMPFSAWLFRIAHNELIDYFRTKKQVAELSDDDSLADPTMNTVREVENTFERKRLQKALKKLPKSQSDVIILKFFSDLSNAEIAEVLEKSEIAIRILQSRGLKTLREIFEEEKNEK
jgi:RNA polymerase sigma-70 factor, ECF subfamily